MYVFVEMWSPKQAWLDMTPDERQTYFASIGPTMDQLIETGIEVVGWSVTDADTPQRADYVYFGVWKMPSKEHFVKFEQMIRDVGWYDYFEQANLSGVLDTPDAVAGEMMK